MSPLGWNRAGFSSRVGAVRGQCASAKARAQSLLPGPQAASVRPPRGPRTRHHFARPCDRIDRVRRRSISSGRPSGARSRCRRPAVPIEDARAMKALSARASVVDEVVAFNRGRDPKLVRLKFQRMSKDPLAFFRGTDHLFASDWPRLKPPDVGPSILICGDLHLENFGAYRTDDGDFLYDINDFDEALVGPCSLDLVRCVASVLLAAQLWEHTPAQAMRSLLTFLDRYRATVIRSARTWRIPALTAGTARGPVWGLLQRPVRATQVRFLDHFTEQQPDGTRRIKRRSERFLAVGRKERERIREAVERRGFKVLDVAFRVAGTGSLGLERYAVLVQGAEPSDGGRILDIKEEQGPALLACTDEGTRDGDVSDARRVVSAQRQLQAKPTACLDVLDVARPGIPDARTDPRRESHRPGPASTASEAVSPRRGDRGAARRIGPCPRFSTGRRRSKRRADPLDHWPRARCRDRLGSPLRREDAAGPQGILSVRPEQSFHKCMKHLWANSDEERGRTSRGTWP